ncbi:MAG: hypothetical protein JSS69_14765 [Acidobacteria bacterium]|nr:hypothetical protein [Acidobacteriota bacterium]MBS1867174.1 hypothetical protein [Acidobacteriota bacterium]
MNIFFLLNPIHFFRLLPGTSLLFLLFLAAVSMDVVYRSLAVISGVRHINLSEEKKTNSIQGMYNSIENSRRLLSFTAYLFGFCIFLQMASAFHLIGTSSHLVAMSIADALLVASALAADVFLVLLLLYLFQWYAGARLDWISQT